MRLFITIPVGTGDAELVDVEGEDNSVVIHRMVEGWYECIDLSPTLSMWMNEEGKILNMAPNYRAQLIWDHFFGPRTDVIVGPVVLTGGVDDEGNTLGLGTEALDELIKLTADEITRRVSNG